MTIRDTVSERSNSIAVELQYHQVVEATSVIVTVNDQFLFQFPFCLHRNLTPGLERRRRSLCSATTLFFVSTLRTLSTPSTTPSMHASKCSCFHSAFMHRLHIRLQYLYNLAWRHVHDVGVCELTSLSLRLEDLNAVIEIRVYNVF